MHAQTHTYVNLYAYTLTHAHTHAHTQAPAILFVDEFDALGAALGAQSSGDESAAIINELLVRVLGFCDGGTQAISVVNWHLF